MRATAKIRISILPLLCAVLALSGPASAAPAEDIANPFELRGLAVAGEFAALDRRIAEAWRRFEAGESRETAANSHLYAFWTSDPALAEPLDRWVAAKPESWAALAARGLYRARQGWLYRGGRAAEDTSGERFDRMYETFFEADLDLADALAMQPRLSAAHAARLEIARAQGRKALAADLLAAALEAAPWSYRVRSTYLYGLDPWWGGSTEEMRKFIDDSLRWTGRNPDLDALKIFFRQYDARAMIQQGMHEQALAALNGLLEETETHWLYMDRGELLIKMRRPERALADFDRAIELMPYWDRPLLARAWIKASVNRNDEALEDYGLAIRIDPLEPGSLQARAGELFRQSRFEEALRDLDDAQVYGWDDARLWAMRGSLRANGQHDLEGATGDFRKAVELEPDAHQYRWLLGENLWARGRCEAIEVWKTFKDLCDASDGCDRSAYPLMQRLSETLISEKRCTPGSG